MALSKSSKEIEDWLVNIDPDLFKYAADFRRLDFKNTMLLKFFKGKDFDKFTVAPSALHRRLMVHHIEKIKTDSPLLSFVDYDTPEKPTETATHVPATCTVTCPSTSNCTPRSELFPPYVYKSPLENALEEMDDKIQVLEVEVLTSKEYKESLDDKYSSVKVDKTKAQCGKCHLRTGHTKRNCTNEACTSAESCCDIDKHADEKRLYLDATETVKAKEKELGKLKHEKESRFKTVQSMKRTFTNQICTALVNSDIDKYTFLSEAGRVVKRALVNQDSVILEKHYNGKVPRLLDQEAKGFQTIIKNEMKKHDTSKVKNPIKRLLQDNEKYPISFPSKKPCNDNNHYTDDTINPSSDNLNCHPNFYVGYNWAYPTRPSSTVSHSVAAPYDHPTMAQQTIGQCYMYNIPQGQSPTEVEPYDFSSKPSFACSPSMPSNCLPPKKRTFEN